MSMPAASGCTTSRLSSSLWIFRIVSRRCLRFISCQWRCVGWFLPLLFFSCGLGFMLTFPCQIQLGPARSAKPTQSLQRGRAVLLFRTTPATIYTIANTGAMLFIGQGRSRENATLAAELSCASDFNRPRLGRRPLRTLREFLTHTTTPKAWPLLFNNFRTPMRDRNATNSFLPKRLRTALFTTAGWGGVPLWLCTPWRVVHP